jgi:hypothetical protein
MEVGVPWFFIGNYSLGWRLLGRDSEVQQRLLANILILLPDPPDSKEWIALLKEYQKIAGDCFDFDLSGRALEFWNLSAGIKRHLVHLLVRAYRLSRERQATKASWQDVQAAYTSAQFSAHRNEVEQLISHAAQGGELKKDLRCPFVGGTITEAVKAYESNLRNARAEQVAFAALEASMTENERKAAENITKTLGGTPTPERANVICLPKTKRTLLSMLEAAKQFQNMDKKPDPQGS